MNNIKIKGACPRELMSFIYWYARHHGINHKLTVKFVDAYGHHEVARVFSSGVRNKLIFDLSQVPHPITLVITGQFDFRKDQKQVITIYNKSPAVMVMHHKSAKRASLLDTLSHEIVHYEQFKTTGDCHHYGLTERADELIKEFRDAICV